MKNSPAFIKFFVFCMIFTCINTACFARKQPAADSSVNMENINMDIAKITASQEYVLQPGDLLEIKTFMEESMTRTLRISGTGFITFPLIGNVQVGGNSILQAEEKIAGELKTYLKNPQISILVKEYGNKTVFVLGQVAKPGAVQIPPEKPLTVLEAITSVGGFTDIAAPSKVRVLRMEKEQQKSIDVDITQITKHGNKSLDIILMPGDVIFVPQSIF